MNNSRSNITHKLYNFFTINIIVSKEPSLHELLNGIIDPFQITKTFITQSTEYLDN